MKARIAYPSGPIEVDDATLHEHCGIRFLVHSVPGALIGQQFSASEYSSGYGLPNTKAETRDHALKLAILVIDRATPEQVKTKMSALRTLNP